MVFLVVRQDTNCGEDIILGPVTVSVMLYSTAMMTGLAVYMFRLVAEEMKPTRTFLLAA